MPPHLIGEIGLGVLKQGQQVLELLAALPAAMVVSDDEAMTFVDQRRLIGLGVDIRHPDKVLDIVADVGPTGWLQFPKGSARRNDKRLQAVVRNSRRATGPRS